MKQKRTNVCQWCGLGFKNATAHMIHVTESHPETIGRGRTMSKTWACTDTTCGHDNPPVVHECIRCGRGNPDVLRTNERRRFVIVRKRPDGTLSRSHRMAYADAHDGMKALPAIIRAIAAKGDTSAQYPILGSGITHDPRRAEVWLNGVERLAWLEVADVTATPNYNPRSTT